MFQLALTNGINRNANAITVFTTHAEINSVRLGLYLVCPYPQRLAPRR